MKTPLFIAKRYLFAKKSHTIINIISLISLLSVMICTGALFIVLSMFNGLEDLIAHNFNSFNADIEITPQKGKTFILSDETIAKIKQIDGVDYVSEVLSDVVVVNYENKQFIGKLKGVSPDYHHLKRLDTTVYSGQYVLQYERSYFSVLGAGVAARLQVSPSSFVNNSLTIHYPKRNKKLNPANPAQAIHTEQITPAGIFYSGTEYDHSFIFVPIDFARRLMDYTNEMTSFEIGTSQNASVKKIQKEISLIIGEEYFIKDAYQQEEEAFKVMHSEKMAIYIILSFILLVASFNIIGMMTLLVLDKQKDIRILHSLGANNRLIKRIFLSEGFLITLIGSVLGLIIGGLFCWAQTTFHLIPFGDGGSYVIDYFPIKIYLLDVVAIFFIVLVISFPAIWFPVRKISGKVKS